MSLDASDLEALRAVVAEAMARPAVTDVILTLREARAYTKHATAEALKENPDAGRTAFYDWCRKWGVKSAGNDRYVKRHLDRALDREASQRREQGRRAA